MYDDVDYCKYGFNYRKNTRLCNKFPWTPRPLKNESGKMNGHMHIASAQMGATQKQQRNQTHTITTLQHTLRID